MPSCQYHTALRFALNDGLLHITCLFGSGDEPRPTVMDKDPFGLLLVRHFLTRNPIHPCSAWTIALLAFCCWVAPNRGDFRGSSQRD